MSSLTPPSKPDEKKSTAIVPAEKFAEENHLKYYDVLCPKCRARPGYPCTFGVSKNREGAPLFTLNLEVIHIVRVELYEVYARGEVNELGIDGHGKVIRPGVYGKE